MKPKVILLEGWTATLGYANGMLMPNEALHIGGQIGLDKDKKFTANDFCEQMRKFCPILPRLLKLPIAVWAMLDGLLGL